MGGRDGRELLLSQRARPTVETVWRDVQEFIGSLNERESGRGYRYRLPTEAEYAVRAWTVGARHGELDEIARYRDNTGGSPHPVGQKQANVWNLYDMLGNVREWTGDWYGGDPTGTATDSGDPGSGSRRVFRGGIWSG